MPMHVPSSLLSSFVTLFVTIEPIETAVIFAGLTSGIQHKERRSLLVDVAALRSRGQFRAVFVARLASRAFPLIASPWGVSAVVLLTGRAEGWTEDAYIMAMIGLCLIITDIAMRAADVLVGLLGQTGADVIGRISGVFLAGLAVQFIFDGLRGGFPHAFGLA
jgi:multiple antibiotic resistance protein